MTLRNWIYLSWTTLLWGTVSAVATGILLLLMFSDFAIVEIGTPGLNAPTLLFIVFAGALFGVLSTMGFFSYMIFRYIVVGIFRKKWMWDILQVCLVVIAFIDVIYLRYVGAETGRSLAAYTVIPLIALVAALGVSYWKMKLTQPSAFIPTLLFMFVVTLLETVPVLRTDSDSSILFMMIPLLVCNAWQILKLHQVIKSVNSKEGLARKQG